MRRTLLTKVHRDIRRQLAQFVSIALIVLLGVALFVASWDSYQNLSTSYQHTYDRLHFADLVATGGDTQQVADAVTGSDRVAGLTTRTQADVPMQIGDTKLYGRVVGLPAGTQPAVDQVEVVAGEPLASSDPDGVLVETHAAETFQLSPGDTLRLSGPGGWQRVRVRGVAVSPEYLWPARSRQDLLPDPHSFAVVFAPETTARALAGGGPNQVLVELTGAAREGGGSAAAAAVLREAGATNVQPRSEQPSNAALHEDLRAFSELAVAFPALFLTAAAVAGYVLLTRRVYAERPVIGTLLAAGARPGRVARHYLTHGVLAGLAGAALGVAAGLLGTEALTRAYTSAFGIPDTVVARHPATVAIGLAFGLLVGVVGGLAPARAVARTAPAEAMRNQPGAARPGRWSRALAQARFVPVSWRMALRDIGRSRRRTLATMLGTVLALVLVLAATGLMLSLRQALDVQFGQVQREDATVRVEPAAAEDARAALARADGVAAVEPATHLQVTATAAGDHSYTTVLTGLEPGTQMHGFRGTGGEELSLPERGVLAGAALADELEVSVGDRITLAPQGARPARVRLAGLVDEPLGTNLYATNQVAQQVAGDGTGPDSFLVTFAAGADRDRLRAEITGLPGVVAYTDARALANTVDDYLGLFWAFVGAMAVLGAVLAFTVIYVTMTVNLAERTTELATLRAAGVRVRRIAAIVSHENLVAVALGVPFGLAAGALASWQFLRSFNSDLFSFEPVLSWPTLAAAAAGVLLAALFSQVPAVLAIRRLDVARVVRERAQ